MLSNHKICVRCEIAKCAREIAKCARENAKCAREIAKCAREIAKCAREKSSASQKPKQNGLEDANKMLVKKDAHRTHLV